ncbi:hydroxymyristoyl-ACP dehydratase [Akkermansia glycaniphila]|uniref:bifunctional UDP-3-O-[3-hydroxymyristoyl] N-acetylglucosamine deacetylase/3-hydroxyacyl-ACP dehydratase n=1 Tax=Akkermansia glycaniphila TaxID=1679444 RepID=UPI00081E1F6F|nr:bifunctional UDP-3-O-[3-hydroxymyristoyl] N-acetylglucosamine deacetylase/3-hydroxyacyl-ACP dehydratase [Akkermansia glycaniphila]OCA03176.1 hydroxymyristoyl-ACP dehydratase [Akkermansia glycaniphila]
MSATNQRTLAKSASLEGTSLHTGQPVTLTLNPAPADSGLKFRRVDLPDQPFIAADVDKVQTVERATTLAEGSVKVHTVEHILSALTGMGVDNAIIEMDANEPPIADGSSRPYVELIKSAGIVEQDAPRRVWQIRQPVTIETKGGSILTVLPSKDFRISVTCVGPEGRFTQYFDAVITPETYEAELSPARTFCFYEDVAPLIEKGLIKGGSIENAIVLKGDQILSKEPLRFHNELARHKAMDMIGDLILNGRRILGHVIAIMPGHGPNTQLAAKLKKEYSNMQSLLPKPADIPTGEAVLDTREVMKLLPHRYPFLMVDRIIGFEGETKCIGQKNLTMNELFFQGHFPEHPVMPGVLQVEAMAQVASILMLRIPGNQGKIGYFMSADKVKFRRPVIPGDILIIETELVKMRGAIGQAIGRCLVNGEITAEAELKFIVQDA